jgi:hypothetical protein
MKLAQLSGATVLRPNETVKTENSLTDLRARREALREELASHTHRQGEQWYGDRVDELHSLTRSIHLIEDEEIAEERRHAVPMRSYTVKIGPEAQAALDKLLRKFHVHPEPLFRDAVESLLYDAGGDSSVMDCWIDGAICIEETGSVAWSWKEEA